MSRATNFSRQGLVQSEFNHVPHTGRQPAVTQKPCTMQNLSKSKLLYYRQCQKRLWLEIHHHELRVDSPSTKASFATGNEVGDIARQIYDPKEKGALINVERDGFATALEQSRELLSSSSRPIFEAGFSANGGLAFADVMLPAKRAGKRVWRMVEVKSSTSVKGYHRDDTAFQAYIAKSAGVPLASIALAYIDKNWEYPGGGDYDGLLVEEDLTAEAFSREEEVKSWIADAQKIAAKRKEPGLRTGEHCQEPYECGFYAYCSGQEPQAEVPVNWLPRIQAKVLKAHLADGSAIEMRDVPDELLNERQLRVKTHTLAGSVYFDRAGAAADLKGCSLPAYFIDFETIQFAVPRWKGTRPYAQIPFQFSVHRLARTGRLDADGFLDLSGNDPSRKFAEALIAACGERGPIFVYNAGFEKTRITEVAVRFKRLARELYAINERIIDLLPIAEARYYHPHQQGSWSIKKVLPAIAPDLSYDALNGVQNGGMAMATYLEAIHPDTAPTRKAEIENQLRAYCGLDTFAMVRLWQFFSGKNPSSC